MFSSTYHINEDLIKMKEVAEILNLKANKKLLQQRISDAAGRVVMLKGQLYRTSNRNDFDALVRKLKSVDGKGCL